MRLFLLLILLFAFLQSAFLSVNLVLVLVIARALYSDSSDNLFLAFTGGVLLSFLSQTNLGYWPLILLLISKAGQLLKKLPFSLNTPMVILEGGLLIFLTAALNNIILGENINLISRLLETFLVFPAYFLVRAWEERFDVKKAIKLRI